MHLHVIAIDRQLTVFSEEGKSLGQLADTAFAFHKLRRTGDMAAVTAAGRRLDLAKSPEENGLKDDELVMVRKLEELPPASSKVVAPREAAAPAKPRKKGKKATATPGPETSATNTDWAALRRGRDLR